MKRHAIDVGVAHERASATPESRGPTPPAKDRRSLASDAIDSSDPDDPSLRARQLRFARAVATPESHAGALGGAAAARWFTAGPRLTALERLEIYRRGYHARMIECLADDYPVTESVLGANAFADLCRAYIHRFPSTTPSLNFFGRHMSAFVRDASTEIPVARGFVGDLTALEWAVVEVIHAASEAPLTTAGLSGVPSNAWGSVRLVPTPALRILRFAYPVNEYFQSFREKQAPAIPEARPAATAVYRCGPALWRMDLTEPMAQVLSALVAGETLGDALTRVEGSLSEVDETTIASRVTTWFREWVGHGLFVRARW